MHSKQKTWSKRTDASDEDFIDLVKLLDKELGATYTESSDFYSQYNTLNDIKNVVLVYDGENAIACGAIKEFKEDIMEIKRMFTRPEYRGQGMAKMLLLELENWAKSLDYKQCILETGTLQKAAIALYENSGYRMIPNYGQYRGVETSICFLKSL